MIEMACPSCGRAGQVPKEKIHARLVCRKCHVVFHMDPGGRPVLGEPNLGQSKDKKKGAKGSEPQSIFQALHIPTLHDLTHLGENLNEYSFPVKPVGIGLGVLVLGWVVFSLLSGPPESVADRARIAAEALTRDDLDRLKSFASDNTRDDVVRWYDAAHTKLEQARQGWPSKEATIQVVVVEEDPRARKGEVEAFIMPAPSTTQTAAVVPAGGAKSNSKSAAAMGPLSYHLFWVYNGSHWMLDGRQSFAMVTR
jgi:hypothetical protein